MGVNLLTPIDGLGVNLLTPDGGLGVNMGKVPLPHLLSIKMRSTTRSNADADHTPCNIDEITSVATPRTFLICIPRRQVPSSGA